MKRNNEVVIKGKNVELVRPGQPDKLLRVKKKINKRTTFPVTRL